MGLNAHDHLFSHCNQLSIPEIVSWDSVRNVFDKRREFNRFMDKDMYLELS